MQRSLAGAVGGLLTHAPHIPFLISCGIIVPPSLPFMTTSMAGCDNRLFLGAALERYGSAVASPIETVAEYLEWAIVALGLCVSLTARPVSSVH